MFDLTGKITPRENYLRLIKNEDPQYICHPDVYTNGMFMDPLMPALRERRQDCDVKDVWGVTWRWAGPSATPHVTPENKVIKDITQWDKYITSIPWPSKMNIDWSDAEKRAAEFDREKYMLISPVPTGLFELSHCLMGFEDALMNYVLEPEAMGELLDVLCDFKIDYLKCLIDHIQPDMVHIHDDWGNKRSLFMAPDTWRALLKPRWAKIYDYLRSRNVMIQHHADCVCAPIVEDMVELGIDIWQGIIPQNNIPDVQRRVAGRMALQGGIDGATFDFENYNEAAIRAEVRRAFDEYVPAGHFIPAIPNGAPITPGINDIVIDEMNRYGEHFLENLKK